MINFVADSIFITCLLSLGVTFLIIPTLRVVAIRFDILDLPNRRKIHKRATPLLGGVAIYLGVLAGFILHSRHFGNLMPTMIAGTFILIVGLLDDIMPDGVSAHLRLLCQLIAALFVVRYGIRVSFLPQTFYGNIAEILITVFWIIGVTNACNYLDGMDGLAAGSAVINFSAFAVILFLTGQGHLGIFALIMIAASLGFLPYNFKRSKMFLGDAGSTFLGFTLSCLALMGFWAADSIVKISIPVLIMGVPIFDMIFTTVMRVREGKVKNVVEWLEYGGKDHFHHYLVDLGLRPTGAVIFIYGITISLGISAIMVSNDRATEAVLTLCQASIIFAIIAALIVVGKRRRSGWHVQENDK